MAASNPNGDKPSPASPNDPSAHRLSTRQVILIFVIALAGVVLGSFVVMHMAERDDLRRGQPPGPMDHIPLSRPQAPPASNTPPPSPGK